MRAGAAPAGIRTPGTYTSLALILLQKDLPQSTCVAAPVPGGTLPPKDSDDGPSSQQPTEEEPVRPPSGQASPQEPEQPEDSATAQHPPTPKGQPGTSA